MLNPKRFRETPEYGADQFALAFHSMILAFRSPVLIRALTTRLELLLEHPRTTSLRRIRRSRYHGEVPMSVLRFSLVLLSKTKGQVDNAQPEFCDKKVYLSHFGDHGSSQRTN